MKSSSLSFAIVTYNNEKEVSAIINNIENTVPSGYSSMIFVIDNGSSDETVSIIKKSQTNFKNIKLIIPSTNKGFGAGNNEVLMYLNSDYHILVNPDITISSSKEIEKMIKYMDRHGNVGLLSPNILNTDMSNQKLYKRNPTVFDMALRFLSPNLMKKRQAWFVHEETGYNKVGKIEHASGAFMFFRTKEFIKIKGFDERYFMYMEDADITRKVNINEEAIFFPYAYVVHEWQRESHKKKRYAIMTISSMFKYFNKWGWRFF